METLLTQIWYISLIAVIGDFLVCYILALFYPRYNHTKQVMSVLGCSNSPVRKVYNLWLVILGVFMIFFGVSLYVRYEDVSKPLAIMAMNILVLYGIGGCILSGIFSVSETKGMETVAERVHGIAAGVGFMSLAFMPLIVSLLYFKLNRMVIGISSIAVFVLTIVLFIVFVMSEKERFTGTVIGKSGLWQRLLLGCMYTPLLIIGIDNL